MKNLYFNSIVRKSTYTLAIFAILFGFNNMANAQVKKAFTQRTSQYSPTKKIYNVKGDFTMLGNTCLTPQNYTATTVNNDASMIYVDTDGDSSTFNSSSSTLVLSTENGAVPACSNIVYAGLYWTGKSSANATFNVTKNSVTKTFNKRIVKLKGPTSSSYTTITAGTNDIYYPSGSEDDIYSAYAEITDYVKTNGVGQYTVADMALLEGNPGGTGYSGGWGIIVIYENSKMKWRDVTIFDGYAYVASTNSSGFDLPVTGFNTVQSGNVGVKLGLMASEGDVSYVGDYFKIRNLNTTNYTSLSHSGNSTTNFFNSSINAGGARNPQLVNNTGIDIAIVNIPNTGNTIIGNSQTSTNFKYGTTSDTYSIFTIAMSVDAYVPEVEAVVSATTINNVPAVLPYTILPGQDAGYTVDIKNIGTEAVNNYKVIVPIPYNATYVAGSAVGTIFSPQTTPTPNNISFSPSLGATGSIVWDFGTLVLPANPSSLLARLTFKLKSTTDCAILSNATCGSNMAVAGNSTGIGATTLVGLTNSNFIQGYTQNGSCAGEPIPTPINIGINGTSYVAQNCPNTDYTRHFSYCSANTSVGTSEIASNFPVGSLFYNTFPVTVNSIQYTDANPIPLVAGSTVTYYAVPSGGGSGCNFPFTITKCPAIIAQNDTIAGGNGTTGNPNAGNILNNNGNGPDTLNGNQALISQVNITVTTPATPIGGNPVPFIDTTTGQVVIPSGTPAGTYTIVYNLCEKLNPLTNCDPATVTITCTAPAIVAVNNTYTNINCTTSGLIGNVLTNDTLNGAPFASNLVTFTLLTGSNPNISFSSNGDVNVTSGIAVGIYTFTYKICQVLNPTNCSNTATISITVVDTTAPVISTLPGTSTISCPATPSFTTPTASDTCGAATLTSNDVRTNGACAGSYSITRTWTATDASGNTATASQTINVIDNVAPVISTLPAVTTISCPASPSFATPTATDNCNSGATLTFADVRTNDLNGECLASYSVTRTWTATDACGNSSTATQTINVIDNVPPVISTLPTATTISCPASPSFATATATDACSGNVRLTFADVRTAGNCAGSYSVTRTWTAIDLCGNISTASQTINVIDNVAPVISQLPATTTISCPAMPSFAQATITDACDTDLSLSFVDVTTNGSCAGSYSVTRTWTARDLCGNISTASQTINVIDNVAPVISELPPITTISCPATPSFANPTITDTCDQDLTITIEDVTTNSNCPGNYSVTRTWIATDDCGNSSTASQTINVIDNVAPVISELPAATIISCPATPSFVEPLVSDSCSSVDLTFNDVTTNGNCPFRYSVTRTWTAIDACGNSSTASQTITVVDNEAPVISELPETSIISCPETPSFVTPTATDACTQNVSLTFVDEKTNQECAGSYSVTRTWTAIDECGNTSTASQTINVFDNVAPVISELPATSTISCPATPSFAIATATDACSETVTLTFSDVTVAGECLGSYNVTRTWIATDDCGNSSTASQTIFVQDTTAPVISTLPAASTISCSEIPSFATPTATDNCNSGATLTFADVKIGGNCSGSYSVTRTWTAIDGCGNTSTASQTINVIDNIAPVISDLPTTSAISCPATPSFVTATATDTCSDSVTLTFVDSVTNGTCSGSYSATRTWTAIDACGNIATATQTINVIDTVAPVISELPATSTISCPATPSFSTATATDACDDDVTLTFVDATTNGNCPSSYSVTRTWTATDDCGNSSTAIQTINVIDNVAPVISELPATSTISCPATPSFATATATDACTEDITLTFADVTTNGSCAGFYSITRTWTATDTCGNISTASQTINVQDITAPTWSTLETSLNQTVECSDATALTNAQELFPTATDDCDSDVTNIVKTAGQFVASEECPNAGTYTNTWTVTDACNNTSEVFTQVITVQDTTAPQITTNAANLIVQCGNGMTGSLEQWIASNGGAIATDNCSNVTWSNNFNTIGNNCSEAVTVIFTATDACNNASSTTATFTVQDTTAPTWSSLEASLNQTVQCSNTAALASAQELFPSATDNCDSDLTNIVKNEGQFVASEECPNAGTYTNTWTVTDACNNTSAVFTQVITVQDTSAPTWSTTAASLNQTVECNDAEALAAAQELFPTATDNCDSDVTNIVKTAGQFVASEQCPNSGTYTNTWTVKDACNNTSAVFTQVITVQDTVAPTWSIAAASLNQTVECSDATALAAAQELFPTATDNCDSDVTNIVKTAGQFVASEECPNSGTYTNTWTVTDACNNTSAVFTQVITVQDTTAPTWSTTEASLNQTVECSDAEALATAQGLFPTASDNCDNDVTNIVKNAGQFVASEECPNAGTYTNTWTVTDACNN
ncbi:HYR-like domain-containing protein, partial [Flavobacterium paronense]